MPSEHSSNLARRPTETSVPAQERDGFDRRDWLALLALVVGSAALGVVKLTRRPDLFRGATDVLFGDTGFNLLVVERLLAGRQLYAEVAFQYGPLPPLLHAGLAAAFGNDLTTYYLLLLGVSLANVVLAYLLIRSCASRVAGLVVVGLGLTASLLIPGSTLGAISAASYVPLERTILLLTALIWIPPLRRSRRQAIALGCAIGAWQAVRFGGGPLLLVAVIAADLLALRFGRRWQREELLRWGRLVFWTLAVIVGVQLLWAVVAFATLPSALAVDLLWPRHMLDQYQAWVVAELRWPRWAGWQMLVGQLLSPLVGATAGVAALFYFLAGSSRTDAVTVRADPSTQIRLLIPFLFFAIASVVYFQMVFHFHQFAWALVIPAAWLIERRGRLIRLAVAGLLIPCFALNARINFLDPAPDSQQPFLAPNGERLWATPSVRAELTSLAASIRAAGETRGDGGAAVLVFPLGAGLYQAYGMDNSLRQAWMYEGMFRPYDEVQLLDSLERLDAVILVDPESSMERLNLCSSVRTRALSPETCSRLADRLGSPTAVGRFLVYPRRP